MSAAKAIFAGAGLALVLGLAPALAASEDAIERRIDRVNEQQDAKQDNQRAANPCKGITKSSTRRQKKACADFMAQQ